MTFQPAKRKSVGFLAGLTGVPGSGKTYTALLLAAGLAGEEGKVGFIDTEQGRGEMYSDSPNIVSAMPGGLYFYKKLLPPFTPEKFIEAINEAVDFGITALVVDSISSEWEGTGGCCEIAESLKTGWLTVKPRHKKFMPNFATCCPIPIIFCLRSADKSDRVETVDKNGKKEVAFVSRGVQPIQEKNFMFFMTVHLDFTNKNPGYASVEKCPEPLEPLFSDKKARIGKSIGEKIREWINGGERIDVQLVKIESQLRTAADMGTETLEGRHATIKEFNPDLLKKIWTEEFAREMKANAKTADSMNQIEAEKPPASEEEGQEINAKQRQFFAAKS